MQYEQQGQDAEMRASVIRQVLLSDQVEHAKFRVDMNPPGPKFDGPLYGATGAKAAARPSRSAGASRDQTVPPAAPAHDQDRPRRQTAAGPSKAGALRRGQNGRKTGRQRPGLNPPSGRRGPLSVRKILSVEVAGYRRHPDGRLAERRDLGLESY